MDRKVKWAMGGAIGLTAVGAILYTGSAGDQTRWGARVARRLGIKPAPFGVSYSSEQVLQRLDEAEFTGSLHLRLLMFSSEERKTALANFNAHRAEADLDPITDSDLAKFTEELRQVALKRLSAEERSELLRRLNEHRVSLGFEPIAEDAFSPL